MKKWIWEQEDYPNQSSTTRKLLYAINFDKNIENCVKYFCTNCMCVMRLRTIDILPIAKVISTEYI